VCCVEEDVASIVGCVGEQVEYKLSDYHVGSSSNESGVWRPGPLVDDVGGTQHAATILDLRRNSFYEFRVLPVLRVHGQDVRGSVSPQSGPFRTKCHGAGPDTNI